MGIELQTLALDGRPVMALLENLATPLVALSEAQINEDWITVADVLEFDLEPALSRCEPLFEALAVLARRAQDARSGRAGMGDL